MSTPSFILCNSDPSAWGIPAEGKTFVGINNSGQITLKYSDGTIVPIFPSAPSFIGRVNSSGSTTLSLTGAQANAVVDIQGAPRAIPIYLDTVGVPEGAELALLIKVPLAPAYAITIRNGNGSGDILAQFSTYDEGIATIKYQFVFQGGNWMTFGAQIPAY